MSTMQEIADRAGVSRGTVDKVLNDRGSVADATKKKVLDIAKELNYKAEKASVSLEPGGETIKIGLVLFGGKDKFIDTIVKGMKDEISKRRGLDVELIIRQIRVDLDEQMAAIAEVMKENISGLIISPYGSDVVRKKIEELSDDGIPVVTIYTDISDSKRIAYVGADTYKAGQTAGAFLGLISGKHAEVGIITGSHDVEGHEERIRGFRDIIQKDYPNISIETMYECKNDDYKTYEAMQRIAVEYPTIDTFIFTAGGVYGGCKSLYQMTVRQKFTVITFDEITGTEDYMNKGVVTCTISQDPYAQGTKSIGIMLDKIIDDKLPESEQNFTEINIKLKENM